jgi:N-acetylglucosamine repressor
MTHRSPIQPVILGKINERQVLRTLLQQGPLSRTEVGRLTGMTPPTVSKAVETLLGGGLLEELEPDGAFGRPARKVRLASQKTRVLGLVIDAAACRIVSAGLDGQSSSGCDFETPDDYTGLLARIEQHAAPLLGEAGVTVLGIGVSVPGLVDYRRKMSLFSPNVPITNGRRLGLDLAERLGVECVLMQEEHALCLGERAFGSARGLDDFAVLDVSTGVGLGVMSGGRLLTGRSGLAGEIGHVTVDLHGRQCGCGNFGCLETVACDSALAWQVSQRLGRKVGINAVVDGTRRGELSPDAELERLGEYLAVGLAAVINLFNPSSLFLHGRLFELDAGLFPRLIARTRERALAPSFADCRIVQAQGNKLQGALAAIIEHRIDSVVPAEVAGPWSALPFERAGAPVENRGVDR